MKGQKPHPPKLAWLTKVVIILIKKCLKLMMVVCSYCIHSTVILDTGQKVIIGIQVDIVPVRSKQEQGEQKFHCNWSCILLYQWFYFMFSFAFLPVVTSWSIHYMRNQMSSSMGWMFS